MRRLICYVDGSSEGTVKKPGPCGAGVVFVMDTETQEFAIPLGHGTNQQAELLAVQAALEMIPPGARPGFEVLVKTDSRYAIGCLTENWNVVANRGIVLPIRKLTREFQSFRMEHVPGHAGYSLNERAHELATAGRQRAREGCPAPPKVVEDVPASAQVELEHQREVIAHLVQALGYYADPLCYLAPPGSDDSAPSIVSDRGATARAALAQLGFDAVADPFEMKGDMSC